MKKNILFVLLVVLSILGTSENAFAVFNRPLEPVVVLGSQVREFLEKPIDGVRVYAYASAANAWYPVPFQVDEFVPKSDPQVEILLTTRDDIFTEYDQESFERIFSERFKIVDAIPVRDTKRRMYLMEKRYLG